MIMWAMATLKVDHPGVFAAAARQVFSQQFVNHGAFTSAWHAQVIVPLHLPGMPNNLESHEPSNIIASATGHPASCSRWHALLSSACPWISSAAAFGGCHTAT